MLGRLSSEGERVPDVRKIAVLRANALGDFIVTLPALEALRRTYPGAEIVLLARAWHGAFLAGRPGPVDRVVAIPACRGVGADEDAPDGELDRFFTAMRRERFDLALQMHGGGRHSNAFILRLGARLTAGSSAPAAPRLDRSLPYSLSQHEVLRFLEIASLAGAEPLVAEPVLAVTPADLAEASQLVPLGCPPIAVIHPGASDPERCWPPERFARVGDALAAAGANVVLTGSEGERSLVQVVSGAMSHPAQDLCGRLSLGGLAGLLSCCAVAVSNDTGPLHLAGAVGAATVGIYSAYNVLHYGPLTRLRHRPAVSWQRERRPCGRHPGGLSCSHCVSLVTDVGVEQVTESALELLHSAGVGRPAAGEPASL